MTNFIIARFLLSLVFTFSSPPTFQDLMNPDVFPDPQCGMLVEKAEIVNGKLFIQTTGAKFSLNPTGDGTFQQRIGHPRPVLTIKLGTGVIEVPPKIIANSLGRAVISYDKFNLRINGDSLFMFQALKPLTVTVSKKIDVGFHASYKANHVIFDEYGGFGLCYSEQETDDEFNPYGETTAKYTIPPNAVLWIGVCPPKPYNWERSIHDNIVWHWSNQLGYPPDTELISWAKEGNIILLQSEVMLWKDWNLAFIPRLGESEFARVRDTCHQHGLRFIVYTSPYYFLKGTPFESQAMNSFENFKGWPPGDATGRNIDLFLSEIYRVMKEYKPDGLYFDGQYTDNPAPLYMLARKSRELLGENGILEWHSTWALGNGQCFLPQADAYIDIILRGEGQDTLYKDFNYLRYFVSCYNTSNSIGVLCTNGPHKPSADTIDRLLKANCRLHTIVGWLQDKEMMNLLKTHYRNKLTPKLRNEIEQLAMERQKEIPNISKKRANEEKMLLQEPSWEKPIFVEEFNSIPDCELHISPQNNNPFSVQSGIMSISALPHTYAYITCPLDNIIQGFTVRLRQGTDNGMSWGPAVQIRWEDDSRLRVGLRSDGLIQLDIGSEQKLFKGFNPNEWIQLRVRWTEHIGLIEILNPDNQWQKITRFNHACPIHTPAKNVSFGKVPYNGEPIDHTDNNNLLPGTNQWDTLSLF
ncbi:MAG TPA: hypothetical protein PLT82_01040 [Candidatus Hydrogenedens sp.]|nr:hypothetical protein [Candidatus Hydrogenedens sp.]HOL20498.1 hypothetical protein [Candidatus Hydrogenedens sp.]HPP57698.1 hypothetical protein [Candidatus Hydrogenedens sp.]